MDLKAHLEELRKAATGKRQLTAEEIRERAQKAAAAAARGRAFGVERSEETRLRTFDKHEAEVVKSDVLTSWVTAAIALLIGLGALAMGSSQLSAAGGAAGLKVLSIGQLREWGFGMTIQPQVLAIVGTGLAIGGLLCAVGQVWRGVLGQRSVAAVARGEKPLVIDIHPATRAGLVIGALICPPLGVILGLIMRLGGKNEDTKAMGGQIFFVGLAVLVALGINMLAGLAAGLKPADQPPGAKQVEDVGAILQGLSGGRWG
jgi:hypothetical protein